MGFPSVAAMGASAGMSTVGAYFSAKGTKAGLEGQAALAEVNARIAEKGAQSTMLAGQKEVGRLTLRAGQLKSTQRAAMAANGIDLGTGSAAEVQASTDLMKEIDRNEIEANAVRAAWGYRTQAVNFENEARVKRATAGAISPGLAAVGTLLGEAGKVSTGWYALSKAGALDTPKTNDPIYDMGQQRGWWKG